MGEAASAGWHRLGRRRVVLGIATVLVLLVAGGATAWAAEGSGATGYRTTTVVHASVAQHLDVIGTVDPVNDASAAFQVGGTVSSVDAVVGSQVTVGQTLASLDGTSLTQAVSSAQSSVASDEAKLTEDEDSQTSGSGATSSQSTTTTAPTSESRSPASTPTGSAAGPIAQDQATLVTDQKKESADQQTEAADLTQADTVCGLTTTPPSPPADPASCAAALAQVSADEQAVSNDQQAVGRDEATLATALSAEQSTLSNASSSNSAANSAANSAVATDTAFLSSSSNTGNSGASDSSVKSGGTGSAVAGASGASSASDSAQQIASDQAAIDTAQSDLIVAQQALSAAQLTSPITGTVASVGLSVGDTVSANSSTAVIVIIGTDSFEVAGTLTSSQVSSVKVGYTAQVAVDGTDGTFQGTVSQVGPVQVGSSGYSYPVVVVLPSSATGLFSGSTADVSIQISQASHVLAVATSAVQTQGTRSYVLEMSAAGPVRKVVKVGIVGGIYTQLLSGVSSGDTVVLANLSAAVPASSTTTIGGFGGFGGAGGAGGFGGGGGRFTQRTAVSGSFAG